MKAASLTTTTVVFLLLLSTAVAGSKRLSQLTFDPQSLIRVAYDVKACQRGTDGWTRCKYAFLTFAASRVEETGAGNVAASSTYVSAGHSGPTAVVRFDPTKCKPDGRRERYRCWDVSWSEPR